MKKDQEARTSFPLPRRPFQHPHVDSLSRPVDIEKRREGGDLDSWAPFGQFELSSLSAHFYKDTDDPVRPRADKTSPPTTTTRPVIELRLFGNPLSSLDPCDIPRFDGQVFLHSLLGHCSLRSAHDPISNFRPFEPAGERTSPPDDGKSLSTNTSTVPEYWVFITYPRALLRLGI
ncbi:hypothetical protein VTJ04DRAFT_1525 [Mycothermus thermophilus]|uniref:uncharacterized protein n=1 Tax=Humicola insolens TaxID=85995 RepID=UPI0037427390